MMDDRERDELEEILTAGRPSASFDREAIRARIEATMDGRTRDGDRRRGRSVVATLSRVALRLAAALALFTGGALVGRATAGPDAPIAVQMADPAVSGTAASGGPGAGVRLDYTAPRQIDPGALDLSLGLVIRCAGCELSLEGRPRWIVPAPPVVELVERGGVAEEAGLTAGDRIVEIDGHGVTSRRGGELLHAMPAGDFDMAWERDGERRVARMNRRIVAQHIVMDGDRSVRVRRGSGRGGVFGAIARWWGRLRSDGERAAAAGARGTTEGAEIDRGADRRDAPSEPLRVASWGGARLGALLAGRAGGLFEIDDGGAIRLVERPVVVRVVVGGPADAAGLRPGDVLTHVDGAEIRSEEAARLLFRADPVGPLDLGFVRGGRERTTTLIPE